MLFALRFCDQVVYVNLLLHSPSMFILCAATFFILNHSQSFPTLGVPCQSDLPELDIDMPCKNQRFLWGSKFQPMAFSSGISNLEFQTPSWEGMMSWSQLANFLRLRTNVSQLFSGTWWKTLTSMWFWDKWNGQTWASLFRTCFLWIMVDLRRKWLLMMFQYSLPSDYLNTIRTRCLKNEAICICFDNVVSIRSLVHRLHGLTHHLMIADLWETWFNKLHLLCWTCRQRHWLP